MSEKIQYTKDEVRDMMLTLDFVAIPIDTTKLKEYTRPVETTVFGIPIKLELINFNNKFDYQYINDDIILQIYDKASGFIDTQTDLEPFQDLFFFIKKRYKMYAKLVCLLLPTALEEYEKPLFVNKLETIKNYSFIVFKTT